MQRVIRNAPPKPGSSEATGEVVLNPKSMVLNGGYFSYQGSLTTPVCAQENLTWLVAQDQAAANYTLRDADLDKLHEIIGNFPDYNPKYPNNNRRPVPSYLDHRSVFTLRGIIAPGK